MGFHQDHCWTVGRASLVNTQGRAGSSAFRGSKQNGACGAWTSSVCSRPEHDREEGRSDHHSQDLRNLLLLSQRLVIQLPCIKQSFPEWYTTESKPLIQSCRNAAVQANKPLQQNLGYEQQQTQIAGLTGLKRFALSMSFYTPQFYSFKKGKHSSQNSYFAKTEYSWSSPEKTPEGASGWYYHPSFKTVCLPDICKDERYSNYLVAIVHLVQSYSEFANTVLPESFKRFVDLKPELLWNCNKCSLLFPHSTLDVRRFHRQIRNMHFPVAQPNAIQSTAWYYFIYCSST